MVEKMGKKRTIELGVATTGVDARGRAARLPLGVPLEAAESSPEPDFGAEHMLINIGPQHPATHGVRMSGTCIRGSRSSVSIGTTTRSFRSRIGPTT
jgi:hypothetical protein